MGKTLSEFKKFISRGNVLDMAVGVIIGGAFGKIVTSFVNDIIMPLVSIVTGGTNFSELAVTLVEGETPVLLNYGNFIQTVVDFLIISLCIFFFVRVVSKMRAKFEKQHTEAQAAAPAPAPAEDVVLLREIRDLLAENKRS